MATDETTREPVATEAEATDPKASMAAHSARAKARQSLERQANLERQMKREAAELAGTTKATAAKARKADAAATPDARLAVLEAWRATAAAPVEVLDLVDAAIRRATSTPRTTAAKADPSEVAAFFKSTGLTVRQIADAVGVSTSVISTVQRENGDRWSAERFERAKPLILAAAKGQVKKPAKAGR